MFNFLFQPHPISFWNFTCIHCISLTGGYRKNVFIPIVFDIQMNSIQHPLSIQALHFKNDLVYLAVYFETASNQHMSIS